MWQAQRSDHASVCLLGSLISFGFPHQHHGCCSGQQNCCKMPWRPNSADLDHKSHDERNVYLLLFRVQGRDRLHERPSLVFHRRIWPWQEVCRRHSHGSFGCANSMFFSESICGPDCSCRLGISNKRTKRDRHRRGKRTFQHEDDPQQAQRTRPRQGILHMGISSSPFCLLGLLSYSFH